ncbi:MAG TPA: hypothetical protein VFX55_16170 [Duganella sp.]|nr:hypothetical protein [Duganella sp.]
MKTSARRLRRLASLTVLAAMLAASVSADAQQYLYRGMRTDPINPARPITDVSALGLTVRPQDVGNPAAGVPVLPVDGNGDPQGMSVVWSDHDADACQLPAFARPAGGNWNGTGSQNTVRVWRLDLQAHPLAGTMTTALSAVPGAPLHALVTTTGQGMTLATFQQAVAATAANWTIVAPPPVSCPVSAAPVPLVRAEAQRQTDSLVWTSPTVDATLPLSDAIQTGQRYLGSTAQPDQWTFVQITSTASTQSPVPRIVFYGWRLHYTNVRLGNGKPANLVLLINGGDPVNGGWPRGALVSVQIDRSSQSAARR